MLRITRRSLSSYFAAHSLWRTHRTPRSLGLVYSISTILLALFYQRLENLKPLYRLCTANRNNKLNGGGERDRTDDLLRARQALSQLSYTPIS